MGKSLSTKLIKPLILISIISASVSSTCLAQAYWFGKNKVQYKEFEWKILKTPHFDLHFTEGYRDLAARTAIIMEYGYVKLSGDFQHNINWRIPVILYGSHSDFQQTNTTWELLPEGVQAFAEPNRRRLVLHYSGSNTDFTHTAIHELVHIFQFDIIYGNLLRSVFSRNLLFQIPLWFVEGISEFYSVGGLDDECEMFLRDATVFDYLPYNLDYMSGYMNYKMGQSAIHYINETYGPGKVIEVMDQLRFQRSLELAVKTSIGLETEELTEEWKKTLRKRYWPVYADKKEPEFHGRKLTDHIKSHNYMNWKPAFSPDGEYIVYYSDRKGLEGIYLINALTGKVEKDLLMGSTSGEFEYIRTMKSSLTWNPDGKQIAFVAKSDGFDRLFIMEIPSGDISEKISLPLDFFFNPSWSPDGGTIALVGTVNGTTDIYCYDVKMEKLLRVTCDVEDEKNPVWHPDGRKIVYTRFPGIVRQPEFTADSSGVVRLAGVDFRSREYVLEVTGDIWIIDLDTGEKRLLISTPGNDESPLIMAGGKEIIFSSDETGIANLYRGSLEVGSYHRFTDILGGIFHPSVSEDKDRLVFSAFNSAGYDLFVMDNFLEKSSVSYSTGSPMMTGSEREERPPFGVLPEENSLAAELGARPDSLASRDHPETVVIESSDKTTAVEGSLQADVGGTGSVPSGTVFPGAYPANRPEFPDVVIEEDSKTGMDPDSLEVLRENFRDRIGAVENYKMKFSPDFIGNGMGVFFSTGFGFGLMNQIAFSDLLGDHHLYLAFNLYRSIEDSDIMLSYYYVRKRIDYSVGLFQFKNYMNSRFSSIGETFQDYRYFTERNYGFYGNASYPFSTFTRAELEMQAFISEREFLEWEDGGEYSGYYLSAGDVYTRRMIQPTLAFIHDSAYYGSFGPVIGSRWMLSLSRAVSFSGSDISRTTAFLDYRRYMPLYYRNYLAFRGVASISEGEDKRFFFLGGPLTMRGYEYLQFQGPKMMLFNLEYRYPLLDAIVFGWPGRWAITNIGGTLFLDSGTVWGSDTYIAPLKSQVEPTTINDLDFYNDFGLGFYMRFGFLILNFQLAWPTDFSYTGKPMFHFYLGPQF